MERKEEVRWAPLLQRFLAGNAKLVGEASTSKGLPLKTDFDVKMLQRKWQAFKEQYQKLKRDCKVSRHLLSGETGSAAEGQPATAQQAVDAANVVWPLFAQFHTAFGPVQRLRDDTYVESCSPFKPGVQTAARPSQAPEQERAARAPRTAARRARYTLDDGSSDVEMVEDGGVCEAMVETPPSAQGQLPTAGDRSRSTGQPQKRSRVSARDVQLADRVVGDRMAVAVKSAELREASGLAIAAAIQANQRELQKEVMKEQKLLMDRQLKCQEDANALALAVASEKNKSREVIELTRLYVAIGKDPAEAYALAKASVQKQSNEGQ
jgi:hypothetical protein